MSDDVRADARRLREGVTPEKWVKWEDFEAKEFTFDGIPRRDAEFIAAAPTLVDRLLAELDRLATLGKLHTEIREGRGAYSVALDGVKVMACDEQGDTNADREARMLRGQLGAALATLQQVRELRDDYLADNNEHLNTFGQHHPIAGIAADHLTRILDGGAR